MKALILLFFVFTLASCNKYDDTVQISHLSVPPYTETGANTLGFYLNGTPWANAGETYRPPAESLIYLGGGHLEPNLVKSGIQRWNTTDSALSVSGSLTDSKDGTIIREEIMYFDIIKSGNLKGVYKLNGTGSRINYWNEITGRPYYDVASNPFTITVKKDTVEGGRHIVSGTFNGTLYDAIPDSVQITGGVFDVTVN